MELEGVKQSAVRDNIKEQCTQLQQRARQGQEAIRTLQTKWQCVMDFRQLVVGHLYLFVAYSVICIICRLLIVAKYQKVCVK